MTTIGTKGPKTPPQVSSTGPAAPSTVTTTSATASTATPITGPQTWVTTGKPNRRAVDVEALKTQNTGLAKLISPDLGASLDNVLAYVKDPARFTPASAERDLKVMYGLMLSAKPEQVDLKKLAQPGQARATVDKIFAVQQALLDRTRGFGKDFSVEIADEMRNVDRALHYFGDTILLTIPGAAQDGNQPKLATEFPNLHWTADEKHQSFDDMPDTFFVTVDGGSEVSDTIKTATAVDAFVSHVALVTRERDPVTGKAVYWVAEAGSARGVYVHTIDPQKWFQANVRSMIHVPSDEKLQQAFNVAGPKWLKDALARQEAGNPILYNFAMDPNDNTQTFCSQLPAQVAAMPEFKEAMAENAPAFPKFHSQLQVGETVRAVLGEWGITGTSTIAPGDYSIDPSLKLVATGRALPGTGLAHDINRGHMRSAVFTMVFNDWMQEKGYRLHISPSFRAAAAVALGIRRTPFVGDYLLGDKLQPHVKASVIASILDIGSVTTLVYNELEEANNAFFKSNGRHMMFEEMKNALEKIRTQDLARYQMWQTEYRYDSSTQDAQENYPHFSLHLEPPGPIRHGETSVSGKELR